MSEPTQAALRACRREGLDRIADLAPAVEVTQCGDRVTYWEQPFDCQDSPGHYQHHFCVITASDGRSVTLEWGGEQAGASEQRFGPHRVIGEFSGDASCAVCHHAWPCPTVKQRGDRR